MINTKEQKNVSANQIKELSQVLKQKLVTFVEGADVNSDLYIPLDISGSIFNIPFRAFKTNPQFIIYQYILSDNFMLSDKGTIFLDRTPTTFQIIYSYLIR